MIDEIKTIFRSGNMKVAMKLTQTYAEFFPLLH